MEWTVILSTLIVWKHKWEYREINWENVIHLFNIYFISLVMFCYFQVIRHWFFSHFMISILYWCYYKWYCFSVILDGSLQVYRMQFPLHVGVGWLKPYWSSRDRGFVSHSWTLSGVWMGSTWIPPTNPMECFCCGDVGGFVFAFVWLVSCVCFNLWARNFHLGKVNEVRT